MNELTVSLNAWIIQNRNHNDFKCGDSYELALEFGGPALIPSTECAMQCKRIDTSRYVVVALVKFSSPKAWIIDFGANFCKERLHRIPRIPNLLDEWVATRIQLQTVLRTRGISETTGSPGRHSEGGEWIDRKGTDAWGGDGGLAEYLLPLEFPHHTHSPCRAIESLNRRTTSTRKFHQII